MFKKRPDRMRREEIALIYVSLHLSDEGFGREKIKKSCLWNENSVIPQNTTKVTLISVCVCV